MTQIVIGTGAVANDGTGYPLRTAMQDINANFTDLYVGTANLTAIQSQSVAPILQTASGILYNTTPVGATWQAVQSVGSAYNSYGNIFQIASQISSSSTAPAVAVYGAGIATASGAKVWGANFATVLTSAGTTGIGIEVDINMPAAGSGYGISINAVGANAGVSALQLNSNTIASGWLYGINFNNTTNTAVGGTGSCLIRSVSSSAAYGINFSGSFTSSEITTPSFIVGATPVSINSAIQILGSASALPSISAIGAASNIQLTLNAKGTGQVAMGSALYLSAAAASVSSGVSLGSATSASATAGATQAVPATVLGYMVAYVGSTQVKIPYFSA